MNSITQNLVVEWSFSSGKEYKDPFNEVELNVLFINQKGEEKLVPAFWKGKNIWQVRFSSPDIDKYHYRTICSDTSNSDLHSQEGEFEVTPYQGPNPLFQHGPLRVAADRRHLQHLDGTPFFWLADTWWMGLCRRLIWPKEFQTLVLDRVEKNFSVIQIVAGLYPDMPPFDERGANEGGFPWEKDYTRINPTYFDFADRRIKYLIEMGLVPCIFGCWGYFLSFMGVEKMKKHWRYLVARYGAYPVLWCLAGEATMPYYLSKDELSDAKNQKICQEKGWTELARYLRKVDEVKNQKKGWTELARYLRKVDPFHNLITIHPTHLGREQIDDPSLLDIDMMQSGAMRHLSFPRTIKSLKFSLGQDPKMPAIVGEVCYEGAMESNWEDIQRRLFWACVLSGALGYTYGATGIWQVNKKERPFGPSPHGVAWTGNMLSWDEAAKFSGSKQLGIAKKFLESYPWWHLEPHPEWVEVDRKLGFYEKDNDGYFVPYAAGIPKKLRLIYFSPFLAGYSLWAAPKVKYLESDVKYRAFLFDPTDGARYDLGNVVMERDASWRIPVPPIFHDWLLVLEAR